MALLGLAAILLAFGAMAVAFAVQERAEDRRILARAEEVLARTPANAALVQDEGDAEPHLVALRDAA
jgi:alpha-D-ribose 1-methylphosphonate 5-triphosphate diphosphatase PhnM